MSAWWQKYIEGMQFAEGGRTAPYVDCFGLVVTVFERELGIVLEPFRALHLTSITGDAQGLCTLSLQTPFEPVSNGAEQPFDVGVMRRPLPVKGKLRQGWWHAGVVTRPGHVLHIERGLGPLEQTYLGADAPCAPILFYRHTALAGALEAAA